ncbi:MAG: hypothetical protein HC895_14860 [Leptolyngbyaceae cyanobacterium SM1_3_5]|nr:hypothetical protein [Leptolyngbyaceae cyanobacterium SM1_3_5]
MRNPRSAIDPPGSIAPPLSRCRLNHNPLGQHPHELALIRRSQSGVHSL